LCNIYEQIIVLPTAVLIVARVYWSVNHKFTKQ